MSLNILNSNTKSSRKAKILPQFSISSENKPLLDLLEIQRKSFFDFLQHGIPHELAKIAVFREIAKNSTCKQELELKFNPETYKFISPNFTPKEAILNGKTYACKVYVQATLMVRSPYDIQKTNTVIQKEKVKQNLNFYLYDKNKRLNASKLLHNTYTKWLQSPFVYGDSLQSKVLQSSLSESLTLNPPTNLRFPTFGLRNNGSEIEKQKLVNTIRYHNSFRIPLAGARVAPLNKLRVNPFASAKVIPSEFLPSSSLPLDTDSLTQFNSFATPYPLPEYGRQKGIRNKEYKSSICTTSCNSKRKNHPSTQNIQIFRPWIFLGELPLMTKRGHFILNGSPRVIVNQIARCPGIYFQEKRRGVGIEQEIRVSADLIPQRGPWLRVQSDWEGRFWARLKQEGRVKYATLYEAFQEFEKEYNPPLICLLSNSYFTNTTSSLFSKSETATFQERKIKEDRQKKALIRLFKNSSRYSLGKLGRSRVNERIHFTFTRPPHKEITSITSSGDSNIININWESEAGEKLVLLKGSVNKNKELRSEPLANDVNRRFARGEILLSHKEPFTLVNSTETLYPLPLTPLEYANARGEFIQHDEPLLPQQEELMAKDLDAIHTCLERLLEGQGFTDDIDNLKNRFIRTSGKLLQQQFELGLFRLNEVIMPLLGNLLPNYSRLTKSKDSTNKNIKGTTLAPARGLTRRGTSYPGYSEGGVKGMDLVLQDANLVDKLNKVKSTRVSNNYNKDTNSFFNNSSNNSSFNDSSNDSSFTTPRPIARKKMYKSSIWLPSMICTARINQSVGASSWSISKGIKISEKSCCLKGNSKYKNWQTKEPKNKNLMYLNLTSILLNLTNRRFVPFVKTEESVAEKFGYLPLRQQKELQKNNFFSYNSTKNNSFSCNSTYQFLRNSLPLRGYGVCNRVRNSKGITLAMQIEDLQKAGGLTLNSLRELTFALAKGTPYPLPHANLRFARGLRGMKLNSEGVVLTSCVNESLTDSYSKDVSLIKNAPFRWLRTSKPINSAFREFFGSNPLSQYMDQTNPLAEITHKRRLSSMGPGGIKRETAGMEVRGIHPTHYGRVCPIETPEGKNAGLVNSPTVYGRVGNYGFLETPLYQVIENQIQTKRWTFFSAQHEEKQNSSLATCDTGLLQFNFLAHVPILVQTANNPLTHFQQIERHRVGYRALSPIQAISIATALIPFLEHDDANRALMGSNMQRQAIPLLSPERPIVGTGFEPLVVMESGQALQATKLGCVSQADANSIIIHTKYSIEKPLPQSVLTPYPGIWGKEELLRQQEEFFVQEQEKKSVNSLPEGYKGLEVPFASAKVNPLNKLRVNPPAFCKSSICIARVIPSEFLRNSFGVHAATDIDIDTNTKNRINLTKAQYLPKKGLLCFTYPFAYSERIPKGFVTKSCFAYPEKVTKSKICTAGANGISRREILFAKNDAVIKNKNNYVNKKHISYSHNTFLLRPLKQDLQFYERSNQETCLNQRPLVQEGDWIQKGDFLADSSASHSGDLALGKNVTVAYMPWEGYNFEDAIVISDRLVSDDIYTSLHIERYEIKVSKNSQGKERITNRVPGSSHSLKHLDNFGIARISSWVQPGDILVGKVVELKRPLSPYERLAWELASRLSPKSPEREKWLNKVWLEDISLRLPPGVCGRVINSQIISSSTEYASMADMSGAANNPLNKEQTILEKYPQEVHLYLAVKRKIQIGDKLAGRHGNKGIVSAILPQEDMPYLGDGSCIDMVLNPLGVPSRMNLGQIFECLLGLAGSQLGCNFRITPFDEIAGGEASRSLVFLKLYQCRLMYKQQWLFTPTFPGKSKLFDGRTGEPFENWVTVGQAYMLKLIHMVDHKIHARSTGPYSLFTRQPVRGRSRRGGQRLGEMEVWAVEGFGAAYTLQEFLTIKSDDLKARTALQKGFYKQNDVTFGKIHIAPGNPEAFKVLVSELQALCLHIQM